MSNHSRTVALVALLAAVLIAAVACGSRAAPQQSPSAPVEALAAVQSTAAPAATQAPAAPPASGEAPGVGPLVEPTPGLPQDDTPQTNGSPGVRKIIKDGELSLIVDDLVRAIDRITKIAVDPGGYVLSAELSTEDVVKTATVKLGVPSDDFEDVMRQLRGIALTVRWERSSGKDVTAEYVDLQSQLVNLQATQARLREFLQDAKTVEEALKVNAELTKIEGEIETITGRMNYLVDRAAYSTITIYLEQIAPTPTVTPTPSVTPTPTVTPTSTPIVWRPTKTFDSARITLQYVLRGLGDFAIWAGVICVPLAIVALIVVVPLLWLRRSLRRKGKRPEPPATDDKV